MFSATFASRIITLAERMMNEPVRIAIETGSFQSQHGHHPDFTLDKCTSTKKLLSHWLSDEGVDQAVVFASTQEDTDLSG